MIALLFALACAPSVTTAQTTPEIEQVRNQIRIVFAMRTFMSGRFSYTYGGDYERRFHLPEGGRWRSAGNYLVTTDGPDHLVWSSATHRVAWEEGSYLRYQSLIDGGFDTTKAIDLPYLAEVDALWAEARDGFPNATITAIAPYPLQPDNKTQYRIVPHFSWWDDAYAIRVGFIREYGGFINGLALIETDDDRTVRMFGTGLEIGLPARADVPLNPAYLGPYAVPDPDRPEFYASPVVHEFIGGQPYHVEQGWSLLERDEAASSASAIGRQECTAIEEFTVSQHRTWLPAPDAAQRLVDATACEPDPWLTYHSLFGMSVPYGAVACSQLTFELFDDRTDPPTLLGTQTEGACETGNDPDKPVLFGRHVKNRKRLSTMLPPAEADHLRMVGTLTATVNCTQAALGEAVKFRWSTPPSTHPPPQRRHDPPAPAFRWDCVPGW